MTQQLSTTSKLRLAHYEQLQTDLNHDSQPNREFSGHSHILLVAFMLFSHLTPLIALMLAYPLSLWTCLCICTIDTYRTHVFLPEPQCWILCTCGPVLSLDGLILAEDGALEALLGWFCHCTLDICHGIQNFGVIKGLLYDFNDQITHHHSSLLTSLQSLRKAYSTEIQLSQPLKLFTIDLGRILDASWYKDHQPCICLVSCLRLLLGSCYV